MAAAAGPGDGVGALLREFTLRSTRPPKPSGQAPPTHPNT